MIEIWQTIPLELKAVILTSIVIWFRLEYEDKKREEWWSNMKTVTRSLINEVKNIICERRYMVSAQYDSTGGNYYNLYVVVDAANEKAAIEKGETKIEKLSSSSLASKIGIDDPSGDDTEIAEVDTKKPLSWTDIKKDTSP